MRRLPDDSFGGKYEIPGGGVEKGESVEQGLKREVKEETGLTVKSIDWYLSSFDFETRKGKGTSV